jgi:hypothetical protein
MNAVGCAYKKDLLRKLPRESPDYAALTFQVLLIQYNCL